MSSNLYAEPIERKKLSLSTALKFALRKKFGGPVRVVMSESSFNFLEGLIAGGSDELAADTQKLIQYIIKHGEVRIEEEY